MVDQQTSNTGRQGTDPKGVDAALAAGDGARRGENAASAAQVFADNGRDQQARQPDGTATRDVRASGVHMMDTVGSIGGGAVNATHDVLRGAIGATEDVASGLIGGVSHVAADLVHGVRDVGYEVRDGATGLIGAVGTVGGSAVSVLAGLLVDVVDGVRQVVGAAIRHDGGVQQRPDGNGQRQLVGSPDERELPERGMMPPPGAGKGSGGATPRA